MKILLQFPEGMRTRALDEARKLESRGDEVIICPEPCWGACDIKDDWARKLGCEKIVHIGHTQFIKSDFPIEYVEARQGVDKHRLESILNSGFSKLEKFINFGILSSVQFLDYIPILKEELEKRGKKAFIGQSRDPNKKMHPGQILGCDIGAASDVYSEVDCFIFVGSGTFHPLGAELKLDKPVFSLNLEIGTLEDLEKSKEKFLKQRYIAIGLARQARKFGILVTVKKGQNFLAVPDVIKKRIEDSGREAHILVMDEISDGKLIGLGLDCYVNLACPRIAIEDRTRFSRPIINPDELSEALKESL